MKSLKAKRKASVGPRQSDFLHFITSVPLFCAKATTWQNIFGVLAVIGLSLGAVLLMRILVAR